MILYIDNHSYHYELENLLKLFFPNEKIVVETLNDKTLLQDFYIITSLTKNENDYMLKIIYKKDNIYIEKSQKVKEKEKCELVFAQIIYKMLYDETGKSPSWGVLTGVRPIKLMNNFISEYGEEYTFKYFKNEFLVSDEKIDLAYKTHENQIEIIRSSTTNSFSLYISIPFCKTRCSYCSFVSQSIEKAFHIIPQYIELLCEEIKYTANIVKELGLKLETVYIGGGTPTVLSPLQLSEVMTTIIKNFDITTCKEFTVEAGRPDTIDKDKLVAIKECGATRISINPQTMNDKILEEIGRKHTSQDVINAFNLSRKIGFNNINMDLIAGLPKDTLESFKKSVNDLIILDPENITVHTLAMKKSSKLNKDKMQYSIEKDEETKKMLNFANKTLVNNYFFPYYLYRQSKIVANLENTAYSKKGYESRYNIFIMDETHSIIACGAAGVTKIRDPFSSSITRIANYKFPYEYIDGFSEMLKRKDRVKEIYDKITK